MRKVIVHNHIPFTGHAGKRGTAWDKIARVARDTASTGLPISPETAAAFAEAQKRDLFGYLKGLPKVVKEPDTDIWNAAYHFDEDIISFQEKFEKKSFKDKVQTFLHEAGHRGQLKDKETFERFKRLGLGSEKNFYAMANDVHRKDYRANGIENPNEEAFAESYSRFAMFMPLPKAILAFWEERNNG